jgi:hypothetical protein
LTDDAKNKTAREREKITGGWRKLNNMEFHNFYSSEHIISVMKSGMQWAWHLARMAYMRNA